MARAFDQSDDVFDFVKLAPGANADKVQAALIETMDREFPVVEVRNQQELKENQEEQINQLLGLIYALLALAVIVSLFGIANTLALSIHERTRELGMLRAIGMSRRQVRTMIRYEAVITALIGAILGMVLGVIFAALIAQPLKDEGFALSYPVGQLTCCWSSPPSPACWPRSRPPAAPRGSTCSSRSSTSDTRRGLRAAPVSRAAAGGGRRPSAPRCARPPCRRERRRRSGRRDLPSSSSATLSSAAWIAVTWVTTSMQ